MGGPRAALHDVVLGVEKVGYHTISRCHCKLRAAPGALD